MKNLRSHLKYSLFLVFSGNLKNKKILAKIKTVKLEIPKTLKQFKRIVTVLKRITQHIQIKIISLNTNQAPWHQKNKFNSRPINLTPN